MVQQSSNDELVVTFRNVNTGDEVSGDRSLCGMYKRVGKNHGKPVYRRQRQPSDDGSDTEVNIYYWEEEDNPDEIGWWFGRQVGGESVWAKHDQHSDTPPRRGWYQLAANEDADDKEISVDPVVQASPDPVVQASPDPEVRSTPELPELPAPWMEVRNDDSVWYWNECTGEVTWQRPSHASTREWLLNRHGAKPSSNIKDAKSADAEDTEVNGNTNSMRKPSPSTSHQHDQIVPYGRRSASPNGSSPSPPPGCWVRPGTPPRDAHKASSPSNSQKLQVYTTDRHVSPRRGHKASKERSLHRRANDSAVKHASPPRRNDQLALRRSRERSPRTRRSPRHSCHERRSPDRRRRSRSHARASERSRRLPDVRDKPDSRRPPPARRQPSPRRPPSPRRQTSPKRPPSPRRQQSPRRQLSPRRQRSPRRQISPRRQPSPRPRAQPPPRPRAAVSSRHRSNSRERREKKVQSKSRVVFLRSASRSANPRERSRSRSRKLVMLKARVEWMKQPKTPKPPGRQIHLPGVVGDDDGLRRWVEEEAKAHLQSLGPGPLDCVDVSHNNLTDRGVQALMEFMLEMKQPTKRLKLFSNALECPQAICDLLEDASCGVGARDGLAELHLSHNRLTRSALESMLKSIGRRVEACGGWLSNPLWLRVEHNPPIAEDKDYFGKAENVSGFKLCLKASDPRAGCNLRHCKYGADVHLLFSKR